MRLHCAVSDRVRDILVDLLQAAGEKVVAEQPGTHKQVTEFMALEGRSLKKIPDLVLRVLGTFVASITLVFVQVH